MAFFVSLQNKVGLRHKNWIISAKPGYISLLMARILLD
jgi:hypothetical protein